VRAAAGVKLAMDGSTNGRAQGTRSIAVNWAQASKANRGRVKNHHSTNGAGEKKECQPLLAVCHEEVEQAR
jgi:hypothetical protein